MIRVMAIYRVIKTMITTMILMTNDHPDHWLVTLHQGRGPLQSAHCCSDGFPGKENIQYIIQTIHYVGQVTNSI